MPSTLPLMRWAGSKRQILGRLASYWRPECGRYFEPFCGSMALFLHVRPDVAVLSDKNPDLINAYEQVRTNPAGVSARLAAMIPSKDEYYVQRERLKTTSDTLERAALFLYLNRLCFNGLYRTNLLGHFNVPYSGNKPVRLPVPDEVQSFSKVLQTATIMCADFEVALESAGSGDFVYLDPPYSVASVRTFTEYLPSGFGAKDLQRLRSVMDQLHDKGATFVLSYANTEEAKDLSTGYYLRECRVTRFIAAHTAFRKPATELIISNVEVDPA